MEKRELVQQLAKQSIVQNDYSGAYVIAPRVGKTKIVIDAIGSKFLQWEGPREIVIATPRIVVSDSWFVELGKWNRNLPNPSVICFASLKKIKEKPKLLVIDEFHELSQNQMDTIKKIDPERLLLVSGTANEYTRALVRYKLGIKDVSFEYSIEEAIRDGIISNFKVYIVTVPMEDKIRGITLRAAGVITRVSERQAYDYYNEMFEQLRLICRAKPSVIPAKDNFARKRASLIYTSKKKIAVAKNIQERINERVLIFTARTDVADELSPYSYHSKNKGDKNLERFLDGEINTLSLVNMGDTGITFPDLKNEIVHQMQSNSEASIQKFLRTCNLEGDKEARIIVTVYKDTVDEGWIRQATEGIPSDKVKWLEIGELDELLGN